MDMEPGASGLLQTHVYVMQQHTLGCGNPASKILLFSWAMLALVRRTVGYTSFVSQTRPIM